MRKSCLSSVLFAQLLTVSINANAITYNESIDGDTYHSVSIFELDVGLNTVTGTTTNLYTPYPDLTHIVDFDGFEFVVPSGHQLTSFTVAHHSTTVDTVNSHNYFYEEVSQNTYTTLTAFFIGYPDNQLNITDILAPLRGIPVLGGTYKIAASTMGSGIYGGYIDYTYTFNVTSVVPIPASVWLFGSGLLGLIGLAKRRGSV